MKAAQKAKDFEDVIMNTNDIDRLRDLLRNLVPDAVKHQFVIIVNKNVEDYNNEVLKHMRPTDEKH